MGKLDIENIDNSKIQSTPSKKKYRLWTKLMNLGMKKFISQNFDIDYELEDKQILKKYGLKLEIINLPGHTLGSIGILYDKYLFCGDALVNRKRKKAEMAYQNQDNEAAKESILKIIDIEPELIFIGHDKEIPYNKLKKSFN